MTLSSLLNDCMILAVFRLIGFAFREIVKPIQKLFLPSSLIGGVILLLVGHQGLGLVEVPKSFGSMSGILIKLIMCSLVFGVAFSRENLKSYFDYTGMTMTAYGTQMSLGVLIGALLERVWPGMPHGWGVMGVFSFHGGHGTAAAAGEAFEEYGIKGNITSGMVLSTIGLIVAMTVGMVIVNVGVRKGWGHYIKEVKQQPAYFYGGVLPKEQQKSTGHLVVSSISINNLALQFGWLLTALFIGQSLFKLLGQYSAFIGDLPGVLHGVFGGAILWIIILVAVPIPIIFGLSRLFSEHDWFEKGCMAFGAATGNTSTGLVRLRAVDPDSESGAGDIHGVYSAISGWKDIFVGIMPMWLAASAGVMLCALTGFGIAIGMILRKMVYARNV